MEVETIPAKEIVDYLSKLRGTIVQVKPETAALALKEFGFSRETLGVILKDLQLVYAEDNYKYLKQLMDTELQFEEDKKPQTKYAKVSEFDVTKFITILGLDRVKGGSQYLDKFGFTNKLTFKDGDIERTLENSSYGFLMDFKAAQLRSGDNTLVRSVLLQDPRPEGKSYRKWIFIPIREKNAPPQGS